MMKIDPKSSRKAPFFSGKAGGESALIAAIRARSGGPKSTIRLGIGDDCALLRPVSGEEIAITTDLSLENVHFRRDWHFPESVGHRCLARGLSDLAAMGARPMAAFLSLAIPKELTTARSRQKSWAERFFDGLLALSEQSDCPLAGGDTAQSPGGSSGLVTADIVLVGGVRRGRALLRSGARPGDVIYVTGALGGAAAELLALERNPARLGKASSATPGHPHLFPAPRIAIGLRLAAKRLANAAIDLSDGLSTDLRHLCEESDLAAEIDATAIPIHPMAALAEATGWVPSALDLALHGGEDYELLFTAPPKTKILKQIGDVSIHRIGRMKPRQPNQPFATIMDGKNDKKELKAGGWKHFHSPRKGA